MIRSNGSRVHFSLTAIAIRDANDESHTSTPSSALSFSRTSWEVRVIRLISCRYASSSATMGDTNRLQLLMESSAVGVIRLDFFGDEVDRLTTFDIANQRSL